MRGQLKRLGLVGLACAAMGLGCAHGHYDSQEPRVSSEQGQVPIGTTTTTSAPGCQNNGPTGPAGSLTGTQGSGSGGGGGGGFMAPDNGGTEANTRTSNQNSGASYGTGATQYPKNFPKGPQPVDNTTNATSGTTQSNLNAPTTGVANPTGGNNAGANGNGANSNNTSNSTQGGTSGTGTQNGGSGGAAGTRH